LNELFLKDNCVYRLVGFLSFLFNKFEGINLGIYRSKLDIIADILNVASRNPKKTQIMYQANLSFHVLQKYLAEISGASLICFEDNTRCYALTDKGKEFLETYKQYSKTNRQAEKIISDANSKKQTLQKLFKNNA
jgi:predicted transcriptional regulator